MLDRDGMHHPAQLKTCGEESPEQTTSQPGCGKRLLSPGRTSKDAEGQRAISQNLHIPGPADGDQLEQLIIPRRQE